MADYYPLIARAIAGLDPSAPGESRRALYERARSALIAQLRGVEPPLTESEITRERLSLEEAVRKVEAEAAQRARDTSRDSRSRGTETQGAASGLGRTNPRPAADAAPTPSAGAAFRNRPASPPPAPSIPRSERQPAPSTAASRPQRNLRVDPPPIPRSPPGATPQDPAVSPPRGRGPDGEAKDRPAPPKPPIKGFSDVTADVDDLGRAAAQANRAARKTFANVPSPTPEFDRQEPTMEDRGGNYDAPPQRGRGAPQPGRRAKEQRQLRGGRRFPFKLVAILGIILLLIGAALVFGPKLLQLVRGGPAGEVKSTKDATVAPRPKIADRVGQPSLSDQVAPVAQRVVLYDEDPADPQGKQYDGKVVWRIEQMKTASGQPGDFAVRADVEIPERKLKMTMSFRRNTDTALPASHTAELTFVLPPEATGGGVANVPGILMKAKEDTRGVPLAGIAVKVTDGFFLVGLNNVEADRVRNIQLLKERPWFDIPLVYSNQRRAIITIEKGSPGERAFNEAFAAWGE